MAKNPQLNDEKKLFLLDKLGFLAGETMIQDLIDLYWANTHNSAIIHMIVRDTQAIYQNSSKLDELPKMKSLLENFYQDLLNENMDIKTMPIVIRGFISLGSANDVLNKSNIINALINANNLDIGINLSLKIALAFKSQELDAKYVPDIIGLLIHENKIELDTLFSGAIVSKLRSNGINSISAHTKDLIRKFLNSIEYKFVNNSVKNIKDEYIAPQSLGIWLEGLALVSSKSFDDASKFISFFLKSKSEEERTQYLVGLSEDNLIGTKKKLFDTSQINLNTSVVPV
ncbi:MAG: hypothetical protein H0U75_01210 [Legionella sp.]|nr:hypothetical protein [Legionella sp.]